MEIKERKEEKAVFRAPFFVKIIRNCCESRNCT